MSTGIFHKYTVAMSGVTAAGETTPAAAVYDTVKRNTLINFANMAGDRIVEFRVRRTDGVTAATYDIHIYSDAAGSNQVFSAVDVAVDTNLKWDYSTGDLNINARAEAARLFVSGQVKSGADPIDLLVEFSVSPAIGGN